MTIQFSRTYRTSVITGLLGLCLLVVYKVANFNFFYAHYYMLFISLLSAFISRNKYALVDESGFTIFMGPLFKKMPLFLKWEEVDSIHMAESDINWMGTFGARVRVPAKIGVSVPAVKITLTKPISKELQDRVKNHLNKCIYPPTEMINDTGSEIFLKEPPSGGFKKFLRRVNDRASRDLKIIES